MANEQSSVQLVMERKQTNCPLTFIHTREEYRVLNECRRVLLKNRMCSTVYVWDAMMNLKDTHTGKITDEFGDIPSLLEWFSQEYPGQDDMDHNANQDVSLYDMQQGPLAKSALFIFDLTGQMHDQGRGHSNPVGARMLKAIRGNITKAFRSIFIVSHTPEIPPELEGYCEFIRYSLPSKDWVKNLVSAAAKATISSSSARKSIPKIELSAEETEAVAQELMGLTSMEIDEALATANRRDASRYAQNTSHKREFDMSVIREIKATAIERNGTLSLTKPPGGLELIGGMNNLKDELNQVQLDTTKESRDDGIPAPKGFLMVGPGGTGKTLITKCIGSFLDTQVVSLDIGACKGSFVGQSESRLREALETINRISPCVCFVDEFEKMWAGAASGTQDGGTSSNMLQTWLRWMQDDKDEGVLVIAACNEVRGLPGPVIRAGRFDDIIYVDLPGPDSRHEIAKIHLEKRGWEAKGILDPIWEQLRELTKGFSGAEIERVVVKSLRFKRTRLGTGRDKPPGLEDFRNAVQKVTPISRTHRSELLSLKAWADKVNVIKASDEPLDFNLNSDTSASTSSPSLEDPDGARQIDMGDDEF